MANFFFKYSDYDAFERALRDCDGEDVVVDIMANDESLLSNEIVENKHVIRKDNRFSQESSFNKFFGPRKSKNVDMKDFSSWKNKNYRETEKQIGQSENTKNKFSFSDFMAERSSGNIYNDEDQNRSNNQKAIHELSSDDPTFKKFSLNDYMRRLEEQTRVKESTRDNEDLIDSIGDITQIVEPDSKQDESFDESVSNIKIENIVDDEDFAGEKFSVDTEELEQMQERLKKLKEETAEINKIIDEPEIDKDTIDFDEEDFEKRYQEKLEKETEDEPDNLEENEDSENVEESEGGENLEESENSENLEEGESTENLESEINEDLQIDTDENIDDSENQENDIDDNIESNDAVDSENLVDKNGNIINISNLDEENGSGDITTQSNGLPQNSEASEGGNVIKIVGAINTSNNSANQNNEKTNISQVSDDVQSDDFDKTKEIIKLISKNEEERKKIEEKLRIAEEDRNATKLSYEIRLKELQDSIEEKDKETKERVLQEKIKNDNKIILVQAEFEKREQEIRRLEKEAAQKIKIGELLKKELKNNLNISNLEMNNKLLEISSSMAKEKVKANNSKTTRKRKTKRRLDSDIIGSVDFD